MKTYNIKIVAITFGIFAMLALPDMAEAQRMRGAAAGRGAARPTTTRQAPSRTTSRSPSRPATTRTASRPTVNKASNSSSRPTLNGGSSRVTNKVNNNSKVANIKDNKIGNNSGNNIGNRVNIDNSKNVNVNVRNNRNVAYRPPYRPYPRPPVIWGGFGFSCFRPYYYHPFTPFYWGPMWHPWGFFIATLATTAIIVSVENQKYHYDQGVFYEESDGGYVVVEAPQGATVKVIPNDAQIVEVSPTVNNYYYGGTYYEKENGEYTVVPPPAGAIVDQLPEGAEEVKIGDETYVKYGDTYYLPVQVDGRDVYEIAQVEEAK
ncbi:DUF6515 family protein [uncultured Algoriphagus sp.]|uniref:DUF6515 family protein n=1 Tax=uncultured Algoriphagus sp. TaxID=417365 RepID=UPI0030EF51A5|tara:strand:- start:147968 stop:148924 length:957 start_codon:yes stop_codon:yes gene_type:complete